MAEDKTRNSHNGQRIERMMENGQDGYVTRESNGGTKVGTHTPGNHARSESAMKAAEGGKQQMHEDRENPQHDHVPGHMGYTRENVEGVNRTK